MRKVLTQFRETQKELEQIYNEMICVGICYYRGHLLYSKNIAELQKRANSIDKELKRSG